MTTQLSLFDRAEDAKRIRKAVLRAVRGVVERHGPKVVAPELDLSPSSLLDCIEERERHGFSLRQFCRVLTFDDRGEVLGALADVEGFEQPARKPELTDSEMLDRVLKSCAKAGPAGRAILEDADIIGRKRRP